MLTMEVTGLDESIIEVARMLGMPKMYAQVTAPGYREEKRVAKLSGRTYEQTVAFNKIFNTQAKRYDRNPFFLMGNEFEKVKKETWNVIAEYRLKSVEGVLSELQKIADYMVSCVKKHIMQGDSVDGKMKPLTERYEFMKEFTYKAKGKPILVRTGQLIDSLKGDKFIRGNK